MFILGGRAVLIASEITSVFGFVCFGGFFCNRFLRYCAILNENREKLFHSATEILPLNKTTPYLL